MSAESRASVPPERSSLVASYVEALVLDYLAAETRRSVAVLSNDSKVLHLTENGTAPSASDRTPKVWTSSSISSSE